MQPVTLLFLIGWMVVSWVSNALERLDAQELTRFVEGLLARNSEPVLYMIAERNSSIILYSLLGLCGAPSSGWAFG